MHYEHPTMLVGAGPAGLCAAHELAKSQVPTCLFEMGAKVGGIARTESRQGFLFDIGGHRFHTREEAVHELWKQILSSDLLTVARSSRIYFNGRMMTYPLQAGEVMSSMSLAECLRTLASALKARLTFSPPADNLEDWLTNRFGRRLYERFFHSYTEKVWGMPCREIQSDWAPQRIQKLSLWNMLAKAVGISQNSSANLISQFQYPRLGCGMMWEALAERIIALGGEIHLRHQVVGVEHDERGVCGVIVKSGEEQRRIPARRVISSIPLPVLLNSLRPAPPGEVLAAGGRLKFRSFIMVGLTLACSRVSDDQWIYVHDPGFKVGRLQVFKNWSPQMVPDPSQSSIGMEYFCSQGDAIWQKSDAALISLASSELDRLFPGLGDKVAFGVVYRIPHAYPIYTLDYKENLRIVLDYIKEIAGLISIGRNGLHRYNNMDHSVLSGMQAAWQLLREPGSGPGGPAEAH